MEPRETWWLITKENSISCLEQITEDNNKPMMKLYQLESLLYTRKQFKDIKYNWKIMVLSTDKHDIYT